MKPLSAGQRDAAKQAPVQHKRRRKLINGYTYDSQGCVISPNGQLVFRRRGSDGKPALVEGCNVELWDALASLARLGHRIKRDLKARKAADCS